MSDKPREPATVRHSNSVVGSYKVLREIGEDPIPAALMTPIYHITRPKGKE